MLLFSPLQSPGTGDEMVVKGTSQAPERGLGALWAWLSSPTLLPDPSSLWLEHVEILLATFSPFQPQTTFLPVTVPTCFTNQQNPCPKALAGPRQWSKQHSPGRQAGRQTLSSSSPNTSHRHPVTMSCSQSCSFLYPPSGPSLPGHLISPARLWLEMRRVCAPWERYFGEESY